MGATTDRRQRGAHPRRRSDAAGAALAAGAAALCLLGPGVAPADTGTGTPPLQLGGTPLPTFTGQTLDPSQASVPDTALDPAGGGKAAKDQPFTGFTLGAGATTPTPPDGQLLAQSNVPVVLMPWGGPRVPHLNVVISMPEVAGGGAGYGCTFPRPLECQVIGRVYASTPNERLVHGQVM